MERSQEPRGVVPVDPAVSTDVPVRPARPGDADAVARLFIDSFGSLTFLPKIHTDEETYDFIVNKVMREQEVFVAEVGGKIGGFVAMADGNSVEHLYVHPNLLRRGIGSALLARAKGSMPGGFRLWCFQENAAARRFYESRGLVVLELTDGLGNDEKTPDALYEWKPDWRQNAPMTWHHGLMARWWAEFEEPKPAELSFYRDAIERFGEPALDLGCGVGRLLLPIMEAGLDVDGVDASADMLAEARRLAEARGLDPSLTEQAMCELDLSRHYGTIFICDSFGIGGPRSDDLEALRRVRGHLLPGGALVLSHHLPYGDEESDWLRWLPGRHGGGEPWPETGDRRRALDGDELELLFRERSWDPLLQRSILEVRARLWREDAMIQQDEHAIYLSAYFAQEIVSMLDAVGFESVEIQGAYSGTPATPDDTHVVFIAAGPAAPSRH